MSFIRTIKSKRYQPGYSRFLYSFFWAFYVFCRFCTDKNYRNRQFQIIKYRQNYHQFSTFTLPNRYPDLFEILKIYSKNRENVKILSFGCSTGEEVASILEYIPKAFIVGVDINDWCLKIANKNYGNLRAKFLHSLSDKFKEENEFDAILCLAVFQQPQNRQNLFISETNYPFSSFEAQLDELNLKLKSGGLLFIDQCDFNFLETRIAKKFQIFLTKNNSKIRYRPLFNRENKKIALQQNNYRVFIKN